MSYANDDMIERLERGRAVAWASLQPSFDYALVLAREAVHTAHKASNESQTWVDPAYPPLVRLLADAAPRTSGEQR